MKKKNNNIILSIITPNHTQHTINNFPYITPQQLYTLISTILMNKHKNIFIQIKNTINKNEKQLKYSIQIENFNRKFTIIQLRNIIYNNICQIINKYQWQGVNTIIIINTHP